MQFGVEYFAKGGYNILGVVQGFCDQFYRNLNQQFTGDIIMIVYDREDAKKIKALESIEQICAAGWLPRGKENEKSNFDFVVIPEIIVPITVLEKIFQHDWNIVDFLNINVKEEPNNPIEDRIVVSVKLP